MQLLISILLTFFQFIPFVGNGNAAAAGRELAAQAAYHTYVIPGSENWSIAIAVPLDEEPFRQLYSPAVLRAFAREAQQLQKEPYPQPPGTTYIYMDARHIAGETQLHLVGYVFTTLAGGEQGLLKEYHERFRVADLNVDEDRVPPWLIDFVGRLYMG
ncbi:MAG: hypothetical protein LBG83_05810 [Oscillospiraceae bacterium]|jgi:hypothetical protein|nr:hypothetical protein [Oscillospiraceae bacterium]